MRDGISTQVLLNLNFERPWKVSSEAEKNNPYKGNFNNENKTYLPARTTTLGYERTEYPALLTPENINTEISNE